MTPRYSLFQALPQICLEALRLSKVCEYRCQEKWERAEQLLTVSRCSQSWLLARNLA